MGEHSQIIKLDATDSTNLYLRSLTRTKELSDLTCVVTENQVKGRGQMGTSWQSEAGKNLTFSVLKRYGHLKAENQFAINACVSLAIYDTLNSLNVPNLKIKWPNDIMSGSDKICGILIENVLKSMTIKHSIIGIGLNVNQTNFIGLQKVSSLKQKLSQSLDLDELLDALLKQLAKHLSQIESLDLKMLWSNYERYLFRKDKPSTFKNAKNEVFMGFIRGVSQHGQLRIEMEDALFKEFGLKEVSLLN